jgi:gamma-glutamylcyclotransferase (GGCT)/AIG2-like uncharacterized protein YtfP
MTASASLLPNMLVINNRGPGAYPATPLHPIFLYGTLMSSQLLAELLTGNDRIQLRVERKRRQIETGRKRAVLYGFSRHKIRFTDYPAVIEGGPDDKVEGYLYCPTVDDFRKLDDFEDLDRYRRDEVSVECNGQTLKAFLYIWCGDLADLETAD